MDSHNSQTQWNGSQSQSQRFSGQPQPQMTTPVLEQKPQPAPSVIRCQLIPPAHMPRPVQASYVNAPTPAAPVFATPSAPFASSQYLGSQNPSQANPDLEDEEDSRTEKNYKTMNEADCIGLLTASIDLILKDTCNNTFRQEIFRLLEVETSDDAAITFKNKLTALCAKQ